MAKVLPNFRSRPTPRGARAVAVLEQTTRPIAGALPIVGTVAVLVVLLAGRFLSVSQLGWNELGAVMVLLGGLGIIALRRLKSLWHGAPRRVRDDLELGAALLAAALAVTRVAGPSLYPLVYLLMAFLVAFLPRASGVTLLALALAFDFSEQLLARTPQWSEFAAHAGFLALFAGLYRAVLAAQVTAARLGEETAVKRRLAQVEERARAYRLVSAGGQEAEGSAEEREKWMVAAVKEVEGAVGSALEVAEIALTTHTTAVFLLSMNERELKLHDCRSASDAVRRDPIVAAEGLLASVIKRRTPMRLVGSLKGITYYDGAPGVQSVIAVPLCEVAADGTERVRGVLVADRLEATPFSDSDERLLVAMAGEVLRAMEVERVLAYIKKTRDEKDRFYRAIEELNRSAKPAEVFTTALELARSLCRLDFAAFTLTEEEGGKRRHRVVRVAGVASGRALENYRFPDNNGLVANVVRYGAPLPGRDVRQMDHPMIFDSEAAVKGLAGLKIFPLKAGDRVLGTLVAGSRKRGALDEDAMRVLEMLAIQAAQSVLRAQLFEQMETMATTDGLTSLTNHRTFQTKADEQLALARRYHRQLSMVLTDIDHFKSVNDTYGHPVGDQVLKGVARILQETARDTDVVARYGGEEFALVMPETDAAGAKVIAERIREKVMNTVFQTELGPLKITLSLGIATYPETGTEKATLIAKADECLYFAKHHGRNKSVTVQEMEQGGRLGVATG